MGQPSGGETVGGCDKQMRIAKDPTAIVSAPRSINTCRTSTWFLNAAAAREVHPSTSLASMSTEGALSSARTASTDPAHVARNSGVRPQTSSCIAEAPFASRICTACSRAAGWVSGARDHMTRGGAVVGVIFFELERVRKGERGMWS